MLVAHGVLPARDEQLVALEQLNAQTVTSIGRPDDRKTVAAFATWRVQRRVRRRAERLEPRTVRLIWVGRPLPSRPVNTRTSHTPCSRSRIVATRAMEHL